MKIFGKYFQGYIAVSIIAPAFKMLEAVFELLVPLIVADIIDHGIAAGDMTYIWHRVALMFGLAAIGMACAITAQYFAAKSAMGMGRALRADLFRHINTFSFTEYDRVGTSTLVTRIASDVTLVQNAVNMVLRVVLRVPFIMLGAIIMSLTISPRLTFPILTAVAAVLIATLAVSHASSGSFVRAQGSLDRVTLKVRENIRGARVVRAFSGQARESAEFDTANSEVCRAQTAAGRLTAILSPVCFAAVNTGIIVVLMAGGRRVNAGTLTQGQITALVNYLMQILLNASRLMDLIVSVSRGIAGAKRVAQILRMETSMPETEDGLVSVEGTEGTEDAAGKAALSAGTLAGASAGNVPAVELSHVTFSYRGAGAPSLKDIDLTVRAGETIGIIGGTGSGKSTLASLICRFYDPTEGEVRIFGRPAAAYRTDALPHICGIVPQHSVLFAGTVRENLRFVDPEATEETMLAALQTAQAEFVLSPEGGTAGLDRRVEIGGRNFSGGQRQRLAIARTLAAHTPILILDDSSSALDYATDAALRHALRTDLAGQTVFMISQRAATVKDADRILVLHDGCVNGLGTHEELLEHCPIYHEICRSQGILPGDAAEGGDAPRPAETGAPAHADASGKEVPHV